MVLGRLFERCWGAAAWLSWTLVPLAAAAQDAGTPSESAPASAASAPIEVTALSSSNGADKLRRSAEAVQVIETTQAKREAADLGEVLARQEGVSVRRTGGLGSGTRFSLNGLVDDQIRFLYDGVPLELAGFVFGIANVPVGLVERVDVYRGVVPVRFGADALGGAVNLASDPEYKRIHASASYQTGSFGTHRLSASGHYFHAPTGAFARVTGFVDRADNDYVVNVEVPDDNGRLRPARVHRANDAYAAEGGSVELGVADRPWAKLLVLRAFVADYDKELPHNVPMTAPFGRVDYGTRTQGVSLRYHERFARRFELQAAGGYVSDQRYFRDLSTGIYDWYGQRTGTRRVGDTITRGEIETGGFDRRIAQQAGYLRSQLAWRVADHQSLRLAIAPNYTTRSGEDRQIPEDTRDGLSGRQRHFVLVTGLEYELDLFDNRLENILFAKDYLYRAKAREPRFGGVWVDKDADYHRLGVGDALRVRIADELYLKASYELATRLPRADEVFGDGMQTTSNLDLKPEVSHNANVGGFVTHVLARAGSLRADVSGFLREAERLIAQLPDAENKQSFFKYQNVHRARSAGVQASVGWTSPGEYLALDGNVTYQEFRNRSTEGNTARFHGDRVPNRPWLFANGSVRLQKRAAVVAQDIASLTWYGRYVHEFYRGWESAGTLDSKDLIASQFIQSVALTYLVTGDELALSSTLEVENLTDAKAFDFFGMQRPGRAAYAKLTLEL